jgi:hypothetical protein
MDSHEAISGAADYLINQDGIFKTYDAAVATTTMAYEGDPAAVSKTSEQVAGLAIGGKVANQSITTIVENASNAIQSTTAAAVRAADVAKQAIGNVARRAGVVAEDSSLGTGVVAASVDAETGVGQIVHNLRPPWTDASIFSRFPNRTVLKLPGIEAQAEFLAKHVPGLSAEQAEVILSSAFARKATAVFGGSRIRGDFRPGGLAEGSDIDIGWGNINANQADKLIKRLNDQFKSRPEFLKLEQTRIVTGNETATIERITSPEEFFQRAGIRRAPDSKAGRPFAPSGSVTVESDGTITIVPPGQ